MGVWVYFWALYPVTSMHMSVLGLIPCCFDYCSFVVLKPGRIHLLLCFFFFLKIALAILGLLWFHVNFRILHPSFMKNVMGNLIGITLNL